MSCTCGWGPYKHFPECKESLKWKKHSLWERIETVLFWVLWIVFLCGFFAVVIFWTIPLIHDFNAYCLNYWRRIG